MATEIGRTAGKAKENIEKQSRAWGSCGQEFLRALLIAICLIGFATNGLAAVAEQAEKNKIAFSSEMTKMIENINAAPNNNVIKFKLLVEEQIDQTVAALEKNYSGTNKAEYIYEMFILKNKIYDNPKLNIVQAKKEFSLEVAEIIAKHQEKIFSTDKGNDIAVPSTRKIITEPNGVSLAEKNAATEINLQNKQTAKSDIINKSEAPTAAKGFAAEIERIISEINNLPNNNIVRFKVVVENETDGFLDYIKTMFSQNELAEINRLMIGTKNKIYSNPKLNIMQAKKELTQSYQEIGEKYSQQINGTANIANKINNVENSNVAKISLAQHSAVDGGGDAKAAGLLLTEKIDGLIYEINKVPNNNVIKFKVTLENETESFLAETAPLFAASVKTELANEMNNIKNKMYSNPKLKIDPAKNELTIEYRRIEKKYGVQVTGTPAPVKTTTQSNGTIAPTTVPTADPAASSVARTAARNNRQSTSAVVTGTDAQGNYLPANTATKRTVKPVTTEVYSELLKQVMTVNTRTQSGGSRVRISGGVRLHYAVNSGSGSWASNSSGLRADVGAEMQLDKDWRLFAGLSAKKSFLNYDDKIDARLYFMKNIGTSTFRIGSFGYFMADGNIYDDSFDGLRFDFGEKVRYSLSYGNTKYTKDTFVAIAKYNDFDYSLEAGAYLFKNNEDNAQNNLFTFGGVYKFSNFSLGSMALVSSRKDDNGANFGYVHSLVYGDLKSWRKGTYNIWAKYYNQPKYTYIAPGMNGRGGWMQGFKGLGLGINYTFSENFVGSLEYYNLTDMTSGATGSTWWGSLTHFF